MASDELMFIDDGFDDLPDRDLNRLRDLHSKAGYRDGISDGQESMLQTGFNNGFSEATDKFRQSSKLRGCISAMMIYFNGNQCGTKKLFKDLEEFLNDLKEIEEKQSEVDEIMAHDTIRPETNTLTKEVKSGASSPKEIETLLGNFSMNGDGDNPSENSSKHSEVSLCSDNFDDRVENHNDIASSCQRQRNNCQQMQSHQNKSGKRLNLKYSFTFEDRLDQLEQLLRSHNVSGSFLENFRRSILSTK